MLWGVGVRRGESWPDGGRTTDWLPAGETEASPLLLGRSGDGTGRGQARWLLNGNPLVVRPYRADRSPEDEVGTASKDEGRITGSLKAVSLGSHDAARDGRMQADVRPHPRRCFAP